MNLVGQERLDRVSGTHVVQSDCTLRCILGVEGELASRTWGRRAGILDVATKGRNLSELSERDFSCGKLDIRPLH